MRSRTMLAASAAWLLISLTSISAHHSIAGVYDSSRRVTLEGTVRRFEFVNPHPFIILDVQDAAGATQPWTLEMDNRHELADRGFRAETLQPGDRLIISGSLARRDPRALYVRRLERPADGFTYEHHR